MSTRRLLAALTGLLGAILGGTAIAIAATSAGPVPRHKPLARAIHDALAGPAVAGITARVTFTNHLIDTGDLQGSDPLFSGASGRMWVAPGRGMRLELQSNSGNDAQILVRDGSFWAYDPSANTVYEGRVPTSAPESAPHAADARHGVPTVADIRSAIAQVAGKLIVSGALPGDVAGRGTYTVRLQPAAAGGLLDRVEVSWDAANAVPLRFAVYAKGDSIPVLGLAASSISYGSVPASTFALTPPSGAKVVHVTVPAGGAASPGGAPRGHARHAEVTGAAAVAKHLSFALDAPSTAGGRALGEVRLLGQGPHASALLSYGQGLGAIVVIERPATGKSQKVAAPQGAQAGLTLPSVALRGASGQELDTALGSVIDFSRGGVGYTVLGSATPSAVKAVARAL